VAAAVVAMYARCPSLPQPLEYHNFADQRCLCCGVPNTLDVVSNAPFLLVALLGVEVLYGGALADLLGMDAPVFADPDVERPLWLTCVALHRPG